MNDNKVIVFNGVVKILNSILSSKASHRATNINWNADVFSDLGIDSLEALDLLTGLEEEFDVNPDQYEANDKRTVEQIVTYVIQLVDEKNRFKSKAENE